MSPRTFRTKPEEILPRPSRWHIPVVIGNNNTIKRPTVRFGHLIFANSDAAEAPNVVRLSSQESEPSDPQGLKLRLRARYLCQKLTVLIHYMEGLPRTKPAEVGRVKWIVETQHTIPQLIQSGRLLTGYWHAYLRDRDSENEWVKEKVVDFMRKADNMIEKILKHFEPEEEWWKCRYREMPVILEHYDKLRWIPRDQAPTYFEATTPTPEYVAGPVPTYQETQNEAQAQLRYIATQQFSRRSLPYRSEHALRFGLEFKRGYDISESTALFFNVVSF
ncbi:hypothetical protein BJ508DRAFT_329862 [Ascobolus immersus RN42]|uniref:Uncharacterized protein n=1 Tax=Ascobolus immersus RN42 TaxID=1160509 RepID=A0A3N4HVG1_ASCIM|nr:hypothetical protein BJ508DRAFT_329862 [Ascobolus immersus RN42]